jgi:hypothetical protein
MGPPKPSSSLLKMAAPSSVTMVLKASKAWPYPLYSGQVICWYMAWGGGWQGGGLERR